ATTDPRTGRSREPGLFSNGETRGPPGGGGWAPAPLGGGRGRRGGAAPAARDAARGGGRSVLRPGAGPDDTRGDPGARGGGARSTDTGPAALSPAARGARGDGGRVQPADREASAPEPEARATAARAGVDLQRGEGAGAARLGPADRRSHLDCAERRVVSGPRLAMSAKAAFYDVDGTLVRTNIVHSYAYYAMNRGSLSGIAGRTLGTVASLPMFGALDALNRKVFNEFFYRYYAGLSEDRLITLADDLFEDVIKKALFPKSQ